MGAAVNVTGDNLNVVVAIRRKSFAIWHFWSFNIRPNEL